ncbi:MAG: hypothetical protein WBQ08_04460 [Candidatus Sulfotelmatobacter sp.]
MIAEGWESELPALLRGAAFDKGIQEGHFVGPDCTLLAISDFQKPQAVPQNAVFRRDVGPGALVKSVCLVRTGKVELPIKLYLADEGKPESLLQFEIRPDRFLYYLKKPSIWEKFDEFVLQWVPV